MWDVEVWGLSDSGDFLEIWQFAFVFGSSGMILVPEQAQLWSHHLRFGVGAAEKSKIPNY